MVSRFAIQANRDFINMLLKGKCPATAHYSVKDIWYPSYPNITLMMDYSHVIKRVHNHISKSGDSKNCTRKLKIKDYIFWDHWINAFKWDHDNNPFPIHRKLT